MKEEVEVTKIARPVEKVVVTKESRDETRVASDTVRKERFDFEDTTDVDTNVQVDEPLR